MKHLYTRLKKQTDGVKHLVFGEKVYRSYEEAALRCGGELYEDDMIINRARTGAENIRSILKGAKISIHNAGALAVTDAVYRLREKDPGKRIVVMDFGGADGSYYAYVRKLVPRDISLQWYVVETPAMASAMQEFELPELRFASATEEVLQRVHNRVDLVFSSGAIQYTRDPWQTLDHLLQVDAPYMIFNRQSLSLEPFDIISVQTSLLSWHGSGPLPAGITDKLIRYPHTSISMRRFEEAVSQTYDTLYTFPESSGIKKTKGYRVAGLSYLLAKKSINASCHEVLRANNHAFVH